MNRPAARNPEERQNVIFRFGRKSARTATRATILPSGQSVTVEPGETLLQAALREGIAFPHNCRVGSCTRCRCRLVSGEVKSLTDVSYVLDRAAVAANTILACQAVPKSDLVVRLDATDETGDRPGRIAGWRRLTHDVVEIAVAFDEPFDYLTGQYADLYVPALGVRRSYSFAQPQGRTDRRRVRFQVKLMAGGRVSGWLHEAERIGDAVAVSTPRGGFGLRRGRSPLLCVAGGSGLGVMRAVLEDACERGDDRDLLFVHGVRRQPDLYDGPEIEALARRWKGDFRFASVLSDEPFDGVWRGERGTVIDYLRRAPLPDDLAGWRALLCGPPAMIDAAIEFVRRRGMPADRVCCDRFDVTPPAFVQPVAEAGDAH